MNLENAVSSIYQIVDQHREDNLPSPFFFIVGAGISSPPVKLAREVEEDCKRIATEKYENTTSPKSTKASDTYAHWLIEAHQTPKGVQRYLRKMMQNLPISKANLRLAHLLLDGRIAKTVFTPNFDDMLERSLQLFGASPLVCDHPLTVGRMDPYAPDIQIVHVHGSYWFYDCCNDPSEITDRSHNEPLSQMLDYFLHDHSPIVVGYSGWEGDVLMNALQRRLRNKLGYPIYWFCYRKSALDSLPEWLTKSDQVRFIYTDELMGDAAQQMGISSSAVSVQKPRVTDALTAEDGSSQKPGSLPSDKVFDALVTKFRLKPPQLTTEPLQLYADQLKRFLGASDSERDKGDTYYGFHIVIGRVETAALADSRRAPEPLRNIREAMSQAAYKEVLRLASELDLSVLTLEEGIELVRVLEDASSSFVDGAEEKSNGYGLAVKIADVFLERMPNEPILRGLVAKGLSIQARNLTFSDKYKESLDIAECVLTRFGDDQDISGEHVARALVSRGLSLGELGRKEEAVTAYADLLTRFKNAEEPTVRERVAVGLNNRGLTLSELGRNEDAVASSDDVLELFGEDQGSTIRALVAGSLRNKGVFLSELGKNEEAIAACDEVLRRFGNAPEPGVRERVAGVLRNKSSFLNKLNRKEDAIAACDEVLELFENAQEPAVREHVAAALRNKGVVLSELGRKADAIVACDSVLERFGNAQESSIRMQAAAALRNKGVILTELGRKAEAIAVYDEVIGRFGDAQEPDLRGEVRSSRFARTFLASQKPEGDGDTNRA